MMFSELFFYDPSDNLYEKIETYLLENGYEAEYMNESEKRYTYNEKFICISLVQDMFGKYIMVDCDKIDTEKLCKLLKKCPECESDRIIPIIPGFFIDELTKSFYESGKLKYQAAAYDRYGTRQATRMCDCCKHKWHNSEDVRRWSKAKDSEEGLTAEVLGIGDWL
ncbi:MAG: hypothetical protein KBT19_08055 [Lachnospiraceae bacterium]|nr:hypothetical protein [Candidatus Colinaster equi]